MSPPPIKSYQEFDYAFTTQDSTENVFVQALPLPVYSQFTMSTVEISIAAENIADSSDHLATRLISALYGVSGSSTFSSPYFSPQSINGTGTFWTVSLLESGTGPEIKVDTGSGQTVRWRIHVKVTTAPVV